MRSTLLGVCLLALSFGVVGCDDGMKKDGAASGTTAPTVAPASTEPAKGGAMEGTTKPGAMEGAGAAGTTPAPAPTEAPK